MREIDNFALGASPPAVRIALPPDTSRNRKKQFIKTNCESHISGGCLPLSTLDEGRPVTKGFPEKHQTDTFMSILHGEEGEPSHTRSDAAIIVKDCKSLESYLSPNPWKPSGSSVSYPSDINVDFSTTSKLEKEVEESLTQRLHSDSLQRREMTLSALCKRYCRPLQKGPERKLQTSEMSRQYERSIQREQRQLLRLKNYAPKPPPPSTLKGNKFHMSVDRLYRGMKGDDDTAEVSNYLDRLYSKHCVNGAPKTFNWTARGQKESLKKLTKSQTDDFVSRLHTKSVQYKKDVDNQLFEKYITANKKGTGSHTERKWNDLVKYLHAGGDQPTYRTVKK